MQAGLDLKPRRKLFARLLDPDGGAGREAGAREVLSLHNLILPFALLGLGLTTASLVFCVELRTQHHNRNK